MRGIDVTVAYAALGFGFSGALAQSPAPPTKPQPQAPADTVQDIVVTAQRRSERLQDVPIAVTALTASALTSSGVSGTNDLATAVPGLELGRQNGAISPFIRGIGNKSTAPGEESAVALYVDGVYIPTLSAGLFSLDNVERVEILKGPQGTLFGRNAAAGVIQIITRDPSSTPAFDAKIGYGNYDTVTGSVYATMGVANGVDADFAAYLSRQHKGWGTNRFTGNDAFLGHEASFRSKWVLEPGPNTRITIAGDYNRTEPNTPSLYRPLKGKQLIDGTPYYGFYDVDENRDVRIRTRQYGGNAQLRQGLGSIDLLSITAYRKVRTRWFFDQDGTPTNYVAPTTNEIARTWSQEVQLLSSASSRVQWIAGAYYFNNRAGYDPLRLEGNLFGPNIIDRYAIVHTESLAGFGQVTVPLTDGLRVTGGLRYTHDRRSIDARNITNLTIVAPVPGQADTFDKVTWRGSIDYRFTPDIMLYGAASRGFKSGVYNTVTPTDPIVRPETVDTYEAGVKTDLLDHHLRLNGAAFYNRFRDIQFQVNIPGGTRLINAARARTYGFEFEADARISDLSLHGELTYLNGRYEDFANAPIYIRSATGLGGSTPAIGDATHNDTIHTPPLTASARADYLIRAGGGSITLSGSYYYNGGYAFDAENVLKQKPYSLVGASVHYLAPGGWGVRLWGKNLTQTHYYTAIVPQRWGDTATPAEPRTYGFTLEFHVR